MSAATQRQRVHSLFNSVQLAAATTSLALLAATAAPLVAAPTSTVLYDYTQSVGSGGLASSSEMGQIIQIAEPSYLSRFTVSIGSGPAFGFTSDFTVRLYEGVELFAGRGDLIWSGVIEDVHLTRAITLTSIDLPRVRVPEIFAWTIDQEFPDYSTILHGVGPHPAHFGTHGGWIDNYQDQWIIYPYDAAFAARFEGLPVPEASVLGTVLPILLVGMGRAQFRLRS